MFFLTAHFCRNILIHHLTAHTTKAHRCVWAPVMVVEATTIARQLLVILHGPSDSIRFLPFIGACVVILLVTIILRGLA